MKEETNHFLPQEYEAKTNYLPTEHRILNLKDSEKSHPPLFPKMKIAPAQPHLEDSVEKRDNIGEIIW